MKVKLDNLDRDDGTVLAWTSAQEAQADLTIDGCRWEYPADLEGDAYAILTDRPGLIRDLRKDEYDLDCSEYMEPQNLQDLVH